MSSPVSPLSYRREDEQRRVRLAQMQQDLLADLYDDQFLSDSYSMFREGDVTSGMTHLVEGLYERRGNFSDLEWKGFVELCLVHPIRHWLHEDPFTRRAYDKPRGYAGDAVLLDFIYGIDEDQGPPEGTSPRGTQVFQYSTRADVCEAVRARARLLAERIDGLALQRPRPEILSVACGHLREANLTGALRQRRLGRWAALDADTDTLQEVQRCYGRYGVEPIAGTVRQVLTGNVQLGRFDFIYSMGLYDYLQQPLAKRLTARLFEMLHPGGQLLIGNFRPGIQARGYMESFMSWYLVYRAQPQMLDLAMSITGSRVRDIRLLGEDYQNVLFLLVTKDSAASRPITAEPPKTVAPIAAGLGPAPGELPAAQQEDWKRDNLQTILGELYDDELLSNCYLQLQGRRVTEGLQQLFAGLQERYRDSSEQEWKRFVQLCLRHPLRELLHQDPFTHRAFQKPRGYAGDAELLDLIYGAEAGVGLPEGTSRLGRDIFQYTTRTAACDGVRSRARMVAETLDRVALEVEQPHVLSLASGHLHEAKLSGAVRQKRIGRWVALDPDTDSLQTLQQNLTEVPLEATAATIRQVLAGRLALGEFDFIYSVGIYDYLQQPIGRRLTETLFGRLRAAGQILITGFLPEIESRAYMESFMDWNIVFRSPPQMLDLALGIDQSRIRDVRLWSPERQGIQFLQITKK